MRRTVTLLLALLLFPVLPGQALWRSLKTPALTLFYPEDREQQALRVLSILEGSRGHVERTLGKPGGRVSVVLSDLGSEPNGLTDPVFRRILLYPFSPSEGELGTLESWWRLLWVHEYTHWVHLSAAAGLPRGLSAVFGNILAPNLFAPTWLLEGIAVYVESGLSPYEGRLNDGTFDAYVAALAAGESLPTIAAATFQGTDFPGGTGPYLYGGVFFRYLADTYGEDALRDFLRRTSSSVLSYLSPLVPAAGVDASARKAFGESFPSLWRQWREEARVRSAGFRMPDAVLTERPGWLAEPIAWDGRVYYRRSRPRDSRPLETSWVYEILSLDPDTRTEAVLVRSAAPFVGPLAIRDGVLYYALADLGRGYSNSELSSYGFSAQVWELEIATGKRRPLFRAPLRTFTVLADGDVLCSLDRPADFGSDLRLFVRQRRRLEGLFETELLVAEIASGPAGLFVSARRDGEGFGVYRVHISAPAAGVEGPLTGAALSAGGLSADRLSLEPLLGSPFREGQLCLAGPRLYFSANPGGHYRVYGLDLDTERLAVADALGYQSAPAFDPVTGRLFALGLVPGGYTLVELPDPLANLGGSDADLVGSRPAVPEARAPAVQVSPLQLSPAHPLPPPPMQFRRGGYLDNLATLLPRVLLPVLSLDLATNDFRAGGAVLGLSALGDLQYRLSVFYDSVSASTEVEGDLRVRPALPLEVELAFASAGPDNLSLTVASPLFWSLTPGLSFVTAGMAATMFEDDLSRFELAPLFGMGLRGPSTELAVWLRLPFERIGLGSTRDSFALIGSLELSQLLGPLELRLRALGVSSFDGSPWRLPAPPGYPAGLSAVTGAEARLDLCAALLRVRRGLWNPGVYVEDLYLAAFSEAALNDRLDLQLSYGVELHLELRAFAASTGLPADLFGRFAVTREGRPGFTVGLETFGLADYIRNASTEVSRQ